MKYHYQYVSKGSVRIELIPEDPKERILLEGLSTITLERPELNQLFQQALETYKQGASLTKTNFMAFPKVALCSCKR